ncbi:FAD:protein FMN transferase [Dyella japonica]|uniref:FAD:protein FMN transferase n=1 Tax=Dyella japonica TaxID=231455 RepID=UPI0009DB265B|nr:FAD:protein FMN transferase [Dyella japonica]
MTSSCPSSRVERARPLLGTTVKVLVQGMDAPRAHAAIDKAFAQVERVHALMSFHEPASDLSRLHRAPLGERVTVDAMTVEVLEEARQLAEMSGGVFDITIGGQLVRDGLLPSPQGACPPDPSAYWKDIELLETQVCLHRPLWMDLGGIAKGYAVDCAVHALKEHGVTHGVVNAGGDLRFIGTGPHQVAIDTMLPDRANIPALEVGEVAVATSTPRARAAHAAIPHRDALHRLPVGGDLLATVVAPRCVHADALTKVVLALGTQSDAMLRHYDAEAYLQSPAGEWTCIGQVIS